MIRATMTGNSEREAVLEATIEVADAGAPPQVPAVAVTAEHPVRLRQLVDAHHDFLWRSLRRLGVQVGDVDDAVQQVYLVASAKLPMIAPGSERSFLFSTALNVAAHVRRSYARRREVPGDLLEEERDSRPGPDEIADRVRGRALLDRVLDEMSLDLRAVLVLFEVEELTLTEIAALLGIPRGTAASRLRRAREELEERVARVMAPRALHRGDGQ